MLNGSAVRRRVRKVLDVALEPYFDRVENSLNHAIVHSTPSATDTQVAVAPPVAHAMVPSDWFHVVNHELRTIELARLHGKARRVVSVGASGTWYFNWFEEQIGPLDLHVGVEAFEPEPADLPDNVRWIPATADRFEGLDDADFDLVYAGQTAEHLWADELTGFLLEARRVLKSDGRVVIDCPNRLVTEHLAWSHGGHTVELSADEISELLALAGFAVESVRGVWRCRFGDEVLEIEDGIDQPALLTRRIAEGGDHPDDSFIWWVVARAEATPDPEGLARRVDELYRHHWPTRISRGLWPGAPADSVAVPADSATNISSLPFYLRESRIRISIHLKSGEWSSLGSWNARLADAAGGTFLALDPDSAVFDGSLAIWTLDVPHMIFAVSLEIHIPRPTGPATIRMPIDILEL